MSPSVRTTTNRLVQALSTKERSAFLAASEEVELEFATTLIAPGDRLRYVHFPNAGAFISLVAEGDGPTSMEVGLVGNEGMQGITALLDVDEFPLRAIVQGSGTALRMKSALVRRLAKECPTLQRQLNRYIFVLMNQLGQSALCTRYHVVEARLARWLLMTQDRAQSDRFYITHAFLAWMLGVRRVGVTVAAKALQRKGLIGYRRGDITVLDRSGLEGAACACYRLDCAAYAKAFGAPTGHQAPQPQGRITPALRWGKLRRSEQQDARIDLISSSA